MARKHHPHPVRPQGKRAPSKEKARPAHSSTPTTRSTSTATATPTPTPTPTATTTSTPYRVVSSPLSGRPLDAAVRALFELSWGDARAKITTGKISVDGATRVDPQSRVREGMRLTLTMSAPRPRPDTELAPDAIVFFDTHVVVVNKPAGISTIPFDESETGTLDERVRDWLARRHERRSGEGGSRPALGVVHRIDKETSGLVVFTRTWLAKQALAAQFRAHTVHRRYLAIAHGTVVSRTIRSHIVADRSDGLRGSLEAMRRPKGIPGRASRIASRGEGQLAVTHVEALEPLFGATLIACQLETGRTHQIRVHLSEAGNPIVGERVYIRGFDGAVIPAPRLMLHAAELGFVHPATEAKVSWERPPPKDFAETLARLRV